MDNIIQELKDEELRTVAGGDAKYWEHKVKKGDTLGKIARKYNTTIDIIMKNNSFITDPNMIKVGWVLKIPA